MCVLNLLLNVHPEIVALHAHESKLHDSSFMVSNLAISTEYLCLYSGYHLLNCLLLDCRKNAISAFVEFCALHR